MTTKAKTTKGAAAPAPGADEAKPEQAKAAEPQQPEAEQPEAEQPKAPDATPPPTDDETPVNDRVTVQLSTRLERRIRAGVIVTREPTEQQVSEQALALLERDPLIKVKRL
jgi:type IV secretory pathway VirB10-like protein